jgi:hypothetical protein
MKTTLAASKVMFLGLALFSLFVHAAGAAPIAFQVTASSSNLLGDELILNNPALNNHPAAGVIVTQNYTPVSNYNATYTTGNPETFLDHPVGVGYDTSLKRWFIYIEDGLPFPTGASFNVLVAPSTKVYATPLNTQSDQIFFALGKGAPSAFFFITHFLNPNLTFPNSSGVVVRHDTGIGYNSTTAEGQSVYKDWYIGTEDLSVSEAAAFFVFNGTPYAKQRHINAFTFTSFPGNNMSSVVTSNNSGTPIIAGVGGISLDNPLINNNPNAVLFVTHNLSNGSAFNNVTGVYYNGAAWYIINPNVNAASGFGAETFNILAFDAPTP